MIAGGHARYRKNSGEPTTPGWGTLHLGDADRDFPGELVPGLVKQANRSEVSVLKFWREKRPRTETPCAIDLAGVPKYPGSRGAHASGERPRHG